MQKAVNRFWDWLFHPSVRKYTHPNGKALSYRYPSPGNEKLQSAQPAPTQDYKTPYEKTNYNVRYRRPTPMQRAQIQESFAAAPLCSDPILRLKKTGLLQRGEQNNPDKVAEAKAKFQQKFSFSVDQQIYVNPNNYTMLRSKNREDIAAFIQSYHQELREAVANELDSFHMKKKTIDDPEIVDMESVDMFTTPHFQQSRINNEYLIESLIEQNVSKKQIPTYASDARFWKAIDDAFPEEEVRKVQEHVGDSDPVAFELRRGKYEFEFDKQGRVVDVLPSTNK